MKNNEFGLFPMFVDLSQRKIVVVGGGKIAQRRISVLIQFADKITVIAPKVHPNIQLLADDRQIQLKEKRYQREDIYDADIVIAATDDAGVNNEIHSVCKCLGIIVNVISDQNKCDFHFPGIVKREQLVVGVNAGGRDHKLVKSVREKIDDIL